MSEETESPHFTPPTSDLANINHDFYYNASRAILKSIIQLDKRLEEVKPAN
ncbi:MAG: hypothetical protein WKF68_12870 [Daejeonella sp.]